jgi:hypothetical protein
MYREGNIALKEVDLKIRKREIIKRLRDLKGRKQWDLEVRYKG